MKKNWRHMRIVEEACFQHFPAVIIFEKISYLINEGTLHIRRKAFFSLESKTRQYVRLTFPILYFFDWLWSRRRITANCGVRLRKNWELGLGGVWQPLFSVKKWSPLSNKDFDGCPAPLRVGSFLSCVLICFSTETSSYDKKYFNAWMFHR